VNGTKDSVGEPKVGTARVPLVLGDIMPVPVPDAVTPPASLVENGVVSAGGL
jgi:hypothetical protein